MHNHYNAFKNWEFLKCDRLPRSQSFIQSVFCSSILVAYLFSGKALEMLQTFMPCNRSHVPLEKFQTYIYCY